MRRIDWRIAAALGILLAWAPAPAGAGPAQGLGLAVGAVHHRFRLGQDVGPPLEFTSTGLGLVAEAQFVAEPRVSLAPMLQVSLERSTDMFQVDEPTRGWVLGFSGVLQFRRWWGDAYVGAHAGIYSDFFRSFSGQVFRSHSPGLGFGAGWESASGRTALFGFDVEDPLQSGSRRIALRLLLGTRWR